MLRRNAFTHKYSTIAERDKELESLWADLEDVPMDPTTETIETDFLDFGAGTHREEIWKWFDERHSKGVYYLLYGQTNAATANLPPAIEIPLGYGKLIAEISSDPKYKEIFVGFEGEDDTLDLAVIRESFNDNNGSIERRKGEFEILPYGEMVEEYSTDLYEPSAKYETKTHS